MNICLLVTPKAIVLSGGVMKRKILYQMVRDSFQEMVNGYIPCEGLDSFIRPAVCKDSGILGAALIR